MLLIKELTIEQKNGFVPDLQNLTFNPFFYKSFWRDPYFTKLYMGNICNHFIKKLKKYCCSDSKILDLGCGAGYLALEFAREGFDKLRELIFPHPV